MAKRSFSYEVISPLFLNGAKSKGPPELRAASVRGQLRYWLRAAAGATTSSRDAVWEREERIFGSTRMGSTLSVRLYSRQSIRLVDAPMLPHRQDERQQSWAKAIASGSTAHLDLVTRPGTSIPDDGCLALQLWMLLGGLGKRSRRMFGAFQLQPINVEWYVPDNPQGWAAQIQETLSKGVGQPGTKLYTGSLPAFPTLHPNHSWIIVGTTSFEDPIDAVVSLFDMLRSPSFRSKEDTFGYARGGRRASPLIAQLRKFNSAYYPVLTAFRSQPERRIDWAHLKQFMETATRTYKAIHAWGGW
jgi:CRISPR-associated protein Cmr1